MRGLLSSFKAAFENVRYGVRACSAAEPEWGQISQWIRLALLSIHPKRTRVEIRDFRVEDDALRDRLNDIGRVFHTGYMAALRAGAPASLNPRTFDSWGTDTEGFLFEGAAFGFALLDCHPTRGENRFTTFIRGQGQKHVYMGYVGCGWALALLPHWFSPSPLMEDRLLGWLSFDGYGFSRGYFTPERAIRSTDRNSTLTGYARRAFDQGLGRSLWFVEGAQPDRIASTIQGFDPSRRGDLWSGVGLAATYAGGREAAALSRLQALGDSGWLAQGAAFAAEARDRAGLVTPTTATACHTLCRLEPSEAVQVVREAKPDQTATSGEESVPLYEQWRRRVRARLVG